MEVEMETIPIGCLWCVATIERERGDVSTCKHYVIMHYIDSTKQEAAGHESAALLPCI